MADTRLIIVLAAIVVLTAGCASPSPGAPSASPTAPASDRATINLTYVIHSYGHYYGELLPTGPDELYYSLDVNVTSDRPVPTDGSWFSIVYRPNSAAANQTYIPTVIGYPATTIGNGTYATGRLLVTLPTPGDGAYGPVPVYGKPLDQQAGPYKVYAPVYGTYRT